MTYQEPINNAFAFLAQALQQRQIMERQGRMDARQVQADEQMRRQNALAEQLTLAKLAEFQRAQEMEGQRRQAFSREFSASPVGPYVGDYATAENPRLPSLANVQNALFGMGDYEGGSAVAGMMPKPEKPDYREVNGVLGQLFEGQFTPVPGAPVKAEKPQKFDAFVDRVDMGDKVRVWKPDGTTEDFPKAASPSTIIQQDTRRATDEMGIRKEFQALPEVKAFAEISSQAQRLDKAMEAARKGGSMVAVDQSLITILNKMLDPSSVVRESEYARTPQDLALLSRLQGKIEKLKTGGAGLTMEEREAIQRMSQNFYQVAEGMYNEQVGYYSDLAGRYGYNPENVVRLGGNKGGQKYQQKTAPKTEAPPAALEHLKQNPGLKGAFKAKYGYVPEGF